MSNRSPNVTLPSACQAKMQFDAKYIHELATWKWSTKINFGQAYFASESLFKVNTKTNDFPSFVRSGTFVGF